MTLFWTTFTAILGCMRSAGRGWDTTFASLSLPLPSEVIYHLCIEKPARQRLLQELTSLRPPFPRNPHYITQYCLKVYQEHKRWKEEE